MIPSKTKTGFQSLTFNDSDGKKCTLEQSSAILGEHAEPGESAVWFGIGKQRAHIDRKLAMALAKKLALFAGIGKLFD